MQQHDIYFKPIIEKNGSAHHQPDELDVIHLIEKGLSFITAFRIVLFSFAAAGLAFGIYFYFSAPKQCSSKMIVHSSILTNQEEIEIIEDWNRLLANGQRNTLSGLLNCREEVLNNLSKISAEEIQKVYVQNNPNGFAVTAIVLDTSVLNELEAGILYGLNNTPYVQKKLLARKVRFATLITNIQSEIQKLAFTKNAVDSIMKSRRPNSTPLLVDISRLNAEWIDLNEKLLGYQEELALLSGVQLLQGFSKSRPDRALFKPLFFGLAMGCFAGYVVSLLLYVNRKIKASKRMVT